MLSKSLDKLIEKQHECEEGDEECLARNATSSAAAREDRNVIDGSSLEQIQIGMKLVPNMDQHNFLLKRMQLVGGPDSGYNGMESTVEYDMKAMGEPNEFPKFYEWNGA